MSNFRSGASATPTSANPAADAAVDGGEHSFSHSLNLVGRTLADVERDLILETLAHCGDNRTRTAGILGISIRTLRNKLKDYAARGVAVPRHTRAGAVRCE